MADLIGTVSYSNRGPQGPQGEPGRVNEVYDYLGNSLVDSSGAATIPQDNVDDVLLNGVSCVSDNKAYVSVPEKTSELLNDAGFLIKTDTDALYPSLSNFNIQINALHRDKQNNLTAGTGIDITDDVISAPLATASTYGVIKAETSLGIGVYTSGTHVGKIYTVKATDDEIVAKTQANKPIVPANLNKAVQEGLKGITVPSTAGTYTLQAVRAADGSITFQWV